MKSSALHSLIYGSAVMVSGTVLLQSANAEEIDQGLVTMDTMVITAGRRAQAISDVQASIEVIGQDKIKTFSGASATEILRQAVGVDARTNGSNSTVSIRGQVPNAGTPVLLLIDGIPRTGKNGLTDLNNFPVEDIEQIEIIRGPMSALYGANASGGVINVITKNPGKGSPVSVRLTMGNSAGSEGDGRETYALAASANIQTGNIGHRFSMDLRDADPFRFDDNDTIDDLANLERYSLTYSGLAQGEDLGQLRWSLEAYKQDDDSIGQSRTGIQFDQAEQEDRYFASLAYDNDIGPGSLRLEGSYGFSDAEVIRSFGGEPESTEFEQIFLQGNYFIPLGDHGIIAGVGLQRDEIDVSILTDIGEETIQFAYIQDDWNINDDIKVVAGLRLDKFDSFGTKTVPRISIGSRGDGFTWRAGYGEAFRAPSVIERFSRFFRGRFLIQGSDSIQPEETETWEAAVGWRGDRGGFELVVHDSKIDGLIEAVNTGEVSGGLFIVEYQNINEAEISGVEFSANYDLGAGFSFTGTYEYIDAIDAENDHRLDGRARNTYKLGLIWDQDSWGGALRARHLNSIWAVDPNLRGAAAFASDYTVADIQVSYQVSNEFTVSVGVENMFDQLTPRNWSGTGSIEDPAGRYGYLTLNYTLGNI